MNLASQSIFDQIWDVAALSIICPIVPVSIKEKNFKFSARISTDENIHPHIFTNDSNRLSSDDTPHVQLTKGNDREKKKKRSNTFIEISQQLPAVSLNISFHFILFDFI